MSKEILDQNGENSNLQPLVPFQQVDDGLLKGIEKLKKGENILPYYFNTKSAKEGDKVRGVFAGWQQLKVIKDSDGNEQPLFGAFVKTKNNGTVIFAQTMVVQALLVINEIGIPVEIEYKGEKNTGNDNTIALFEVCKLV